MGILLPVGFWGRFNDSPGFVKGERPARPLRVMTYNIHHGIDADWRLDLKAIVRVIALENPDVIVLNEVNRARPSNGFVDTLPLISRQLRMVYVFGANQRDGLYGNAVLSRYPILEWGNTHYSHNTTQVRGLLHVVVDAPGGAVTILGTHLDHLDHQHARAEQVAEALEVWAGAPRTVLLGDLNAEPHAPELSAVYAAGFVDVLAESGLDDVFTFWDPAPSRRLDFIFVTPDLPLLHAWVVPSRASDHLPVLAEIGP
jgi:endonuclease/exonuclease/phosphatase family metal-dependent hydrolase